MKNKLLVLASIATLVACSSNKNEAPKIDYHTPGVKNPSDSLIVPPDLTGITNNSQYVLPAGTGAVRASQISNIDTPKATGDSQTVLPQVKNMHIEREGSQRWLSIDNQQPQEIWPMLKVFWQENGFIIDQENPETGFMQTQWAENRATIPSDPIRRFFQKIGLGGVYSSAYRDRFVIRLERQKGGGSLVTFSHQGVEEELIGKQKDTSKWVPRDNDPNLEAQMLSRFMMRLGADQATVERELQQNASNSNSEMAKLDGNNLILLSDGHDRNVRRLGLALNRIGLTVLDLQDNVYTVQPADIEHEAVSNKKPGLFSRMFGKKQNQANQEKQQLKVVINSSSGASRVTLHNSDGSEYKNKNVSDIMNRLWRELR